MPKTINDRVQALETSLTVLAKDLTTLSERIQIAAERIAKVEGISEGAGKDNSHPHFNVVLTATLSALILYLAWLGVTTHNNSVAISNIGRANASNAENQVHDALAEATEKSLNGDKQTAVAYLTAAKLSIDNLRRLKIKPSAAFFTGSVDNLRKLDAETSDSPIVLDALTSLAMYRADDLNKILLLNRSAIKSNASITLITADLTASQFRDAGYTVFVSTEKSAIFPQRGRSFQIWYWTNANRIYQV